MADRLDIEEQNKVRAALGMKPLPVPSSNGTSSNLNFKTSSTAADGQDVDEEDTTSTLDKRHAAASDNWQRLKDEAESKKKREARRAALKKERDAVQRFAKLEGKGLGEADDDEKDTRSWLLESNKRQKKIQKKRARMLAAELEERENQAQYTERDLKGKKVGHEVGDFDEGEQILTLKDAEVDAEEDDELENINLREKDRLNDRLQLKKKRVPYDPNEIDETGEKKILSQYDEEIDGKQSKRFTLGGNGKMVEKNTAFSNGTSADRQPMKFSLDLFQEEKPVSDYLDISEVRIKKPKKKKDKAKRQKAIDDDDMFPVGEPADEQNQMDVDTNSTSGAGTKRNSEATFGDDDDLQASLAMQRRNALKKRKIARPEDVARQMREEASATPMDTGDDSADNEDGGLVIDETSEFVSNLQKPQALGASKSTYTPRVKQESPELSEEADKAEDADMNDAGGDSSDSQDAKRLVKQEEAPHESTTGLENEKTLTGGIGSALSLLTSRGLLKSANTGDLNAEFRERQRFLHEKHKREEAAERKARLQRERDRASGKFDRMSARERENYAQQENKQRDQADSRQMAEIFNREYKPQIELKYPDEMGRSMNQKEAFKYMSHQFHGKGSGKMKTEKRLKKIESEKKAASQSSLGTELGGISGAAGDRAKKNREAGVRLQ